MSSPLHCISLPPVKVPASGKVPVVILLHGYGSHENDLFSFAEDLNESHYIFSLRAPIHLGFGGFAWYPIQWNEDGNKWTDTDAGLESLALLEAFIEGMEEEYPVDAHQITLVGFSQGAIMSYAYSFRHPERIRKVAALSGYIAEELMPQKVALQIVQKIPFLLIHGTEDPVIPYAWAENTADKLEKLEIPHRFMGYKMAHGINPEAYRAFLDWFRRP